MCIYMGENENLTYKSQEHVFSAAIGGIKKLDLGIVSDQANNYFSKLERDVFQKGLLQIPRIILGPGKRGSLSEKKATTSDVIIMKCEDRERLGYIKKTQGYLLGQIIIHGNEMMYECGKNIVNSEDDAKNLIYRIKKIEDKFVPIKLTKNSSEIIITYFKNKIYIASYNNITKEKLLEIKKIFNDCEVGLGEHRKGNNIKLEGTIPIEDNIINLKKVIAKTAVNTVAYLEGKEFINLSQFKKIKDLIINETEGIDEYVIEISEGAEIFKRRLELKENQHACIITRDNNILNAIVYIYNRCWQVELANNIKKDISAPIIGYICDWENKKEYKFFDYYKEMNIFLDKQQTDKVSD